MIEKATCWRVDDKIVCKNDKVEYQGEEYKIQHVHQSGKVLLIKDRKLKMEDIEKVI